MYTAVTVAFLFLLALLVPVHHHSNTGHLVAEAYEALHNHHSRRLSLRH